MTLTSLVATYRLTTPMFCAGANQDAAAELRPASFKGILRFWYRAIALATYDGNVQEVRDAEAALFGSTDTGQYDLPFEAADGNAGVPKKFYAGNLEEREGKKVARLFSLTPPSEERTIPG